MSERTEYTCGGCGKKMFSDDPQEERKRWRRTTWGQLWYFTGFGGHSDSVSFLSCSRECRLKQLAKHGVTFSEAESHEALHQALETIGQCERQELEAKVKSLELQLEVATAAPPKAVTLEDLKELILASVHSSDSLRADERSRQSIPIGSDIAEDQLEHAAALKALSDLDKALEPIDPEGRLGSRMERALAVQVQVGHSRRVLDRWRAFNDAVQALQLEVTDLSGLCPDELSARVAQLAALSDHVDKVRQGIGGQP